MAGVFIAGAITGVICFCFGFIVCGLLSSRNDLPLLYNRYPGFGPVSTL